MDRLFDPGPGLETPVDEPLSADRRRTLQQRANLAAGRHPATGLPLAGNARTCHGCIHARSFGDNRRRFWKCDQHRLGMSHSAASDIRVSWPACTSFKDRTQ